MRQEPTARFRLGVAADAAIADCEQVAGTVSLPRADSTQQRIPRRDKGRRTVEFMDGIGGWGGQERGLLKIQQHAIKINLEVVSGIRGQGEASPVVNGRGQREVIGGFIQNSRGFSR